MKLDIKYEKLFGAWRATCGKLEVRESTKALAKSAIERAIMNFLNDPQNEPVMLRRASDGEVVAVVSDLVHGGSNVYRASLSGAPVSKHICSSNRGKIDEANGWMDNG